VNNVNCVNSETNIGADAGLRAVLPVHATVHAVHPAQSVEPSTDTAQPEILSHDLLSPN
jgi:hypothetical protein